MIIFTHRGLEPDREKFYSESSLEAFKNHLSRGYSLEFDPNRCKNGFVVQHDKTLKRITNGRDERAFKEVSLADIKKIKLENGTIPTLDELFLEINKSDSIQALHMKHSLQEEETFELFIEFLKKHQDILKKIVFFDVRIETAKKLKKIFPNILLAPSVVHHYDKKRYNEAVGKTLYTFDEIEQHKELFSWVWLDEWDLSDEKGTKSLYNKETFSRCQKLNLKIALVTPELHKSSPGLLGKEAHPDAKNKTDLFKRIKKIIDLKPDALCTDYPEAVKEMIKKHN